jgi:hypothetical protein
MSLNDAETKAKAADWCGSNDMVEKVTCNVSVGTATTLPASRAGVATVSISLAISGTLSPAIL